MLVGRITSARLLLACGAALFLLLVWARQTPSSGSRPSRLLQQHIKQRTKPGGRYYIPQSWIDGQDEIHTTQNTNSILDAAELALEMSLRGSHFLPGTKIPMIVHQTWGSLDPDTWPPIVQQSTHEWLSLAVNEKHKDKRPEFAYFLWDDAGIEALFETYQPSMWKHFQMLPYSVEKADAFRVAVLRWFGGIYTDVDVKPLKHPNYWVQPSDIQPWTDHASGREHGPGVAAMQSYQHPEITPNSWRWLTAGIDLNGLAGVGAIFGIECDTRPDADDYWRMGYSYPVQLTNWAMAMAPHHPVAAGFLEHLTEEIDANSTRLPEIDPLDLTGPPALTSAVKNFTEIHDPGLRWDALSGLDDAAGGRGKLVAGDVLVLPITAFSPGRGVFHNMGSQPVTHNNARIQHMAAGSWRTTDVKVHMGKFCRTFLGQCKDWKKIPDPPKTHA